MSNKTRVIFLGTPEFSVLPFITLTEMDNIEIISAITNLDKPVGRKQILTPPPVKTEALKRNIKVLQYKKIRVEGVEDIKALKPDLMITCAFGQILSQEILDIPRLGVINIHASLLPKYRGASPIHYAILNGEKETGVTIMKTDVGIDTGDIISFEKTQIKDGETTGDLFNRLSVMGANLIKKTLPDIINGTCKPIKQNEENATYSKTVQKEDALLNFNDSAKVNVNKIRAYNPSPVAFTYLSGQPLKIYNATESDIEIKGDIGEMIVINKQLYIKCKEGSIKVLSLQKAGGNVLDYKAFINGIKSEKIVLG